MHFFLIKTFKTLEILRLINEIFNCVRRRNRAVGNGAPGFHPDTNTPKRQARASNIAKPSGSLCTDEPPYARTDNYRNGIDVPDRPLKLPDWRRNVCLSPHWAPDSLVHTSRRYEFPHEHMMDCVARYHQFRSRRTQVSATTTPQC